MNGYIRLSANDTTVIMVVPYTAVQLIAMGYYPVVTAGSTEVVYRKG